MLRRGEIPIEELADSLDLWVNDLEGESLQGAFRDCLPILLEDYESHFVASEGPSGRWAPRKDKLPHPLLMLTWKLLGAATQEGDPGNIADVQPRSLTTGVSGDVVNYASYHQYGTSKMVARPFLWVSASALEACEEAFTRSAFVILVGA